MFDIGSGELLLVAIVALLVVGPKDLPRLLRTVGQWVGKARGAARHFRTGIDTMIREAELDEMQKEWDARNRNVMTAHPQPAAEHAESLPLPAPRSPSTPPPKPE